MSLTKISRNRIGRLKPNGFRLIAATVAIVLVGMVVVLCYERQSLREQLILEQANASVLRQDCQRMQREINDSRRQTCARKGTTSADTSETNCAQTFRGTLRASSYQDRAVEVGIPPNTFPKTDVLLLHLEAPQTAIGYVAGDSVASERDVALIRVPDGLGVNGEFISIEVGEPVFWASDVSGQLWDLDLSGLQSLEVSPLP